MSKPESYPAGMSAEGFKALTEGRTITRLGRSVFIPARHTPEELLGILSEMEARGEKVGTPTCDAFMSSLGIGHGPFAGDGTGSYCHDDNLHPNNHVASSDARK